MAKNNKPRAKNPKNTSAGDVVALLATALRGAQQPKNSKKKSKNQKQPAPAGVRFPLALPGDLRPTLNQRDYAAVRSAVVTCMNHGAGLMRLNGDRIEFSVDCTPDRKMLERISSTSSSPASS
ncbi:N protein [Olivier's shrew virus 3]|nr:N protein [Olivier's shrew virus 3]